MIIDEFLNLLTEVYVRVAADGVPTPQCVDLAQLWNRVIGGPRFTGNAVDIFNQAGAFYTQITNTPDVQPQAGDIVIWGSNAYHGPAGHVAIATGNNTDLNNFETLEQNDEIGTDSHIKLYNYDDVLGWLRPNTLPGPVSQPNPQPVFTDQTHIPVNTDSHGYNWGEMELQAVRSTMGDQKTEIENLNNNSQGLQVQILILQTDKLKLEDQVKNLTSANNQQADIIASLHKQVGNIPQPTSVSLWDRIKNFFRF